MDLIGAKLTSDVNVLSAALFISQATGKTGSVVDVAFVPCCSSL